MTPEGGTEPCEPALGCAVPFAVIIGIEVYPPPPGILSAPPSANDTWLRRCLHGWRLRGSGCAPPRLVNPASATALCNEVTLLICLGLLFFLQLYIGLGPIQAGWAPPPRLAPGGHAPPPRHATAQRIECPAQRTSIFIMNLK